MIGSLSATLIGVIIISLTGAPVLLALGYAIVMMAAFRWDDARRLAS